MLFLSCDSFGDFAGVGVGFISALISFEIHSCPIHL